MTTPTPAREQPDFEQQARSVYFAHGSPMADVQDRIAHALKTAFALGVAAGREQERNAKADRVEQARRECGASDRFPTTTEAKGDSEYGN